MTDALDKNSSESIALASGAVSSSKKYRYYVLGLMTLVTALSFVDRQLIGILGPQIQADLKLADWQMGLLTGLLFAVLYVIACIPVARLADKTSKVWVITGAVGLWSGFTAVCGFAQNFTQLALARVGVSIGEAGGTAPVHALLSDYFPKEMRARALAIVNMGIPFGVAFAFLGGGFIAAELGWRMTFIVIGLPGVLIALIVKLTVREPKTGQFNKASPISALETDKQNDFVIMFNAAKHMLTIPTYRNMVAGMTCSALTTYSLGAFIVFYFLRSHPELSFLNLMFALGMITLFFNTLSGLIGGVLVDKLALKDRAWYGRIPAIGMFLLFLSYVSLYWSGSVAIALVALTFVNLFAGIFIPPSYAIAQTLAPPEIRSLSSAVMLFIFNLVGLGLGPTLTGAISSALEPRYGNAVSLQIGLTVVAFFAVLGALFYLRAAKTVDADWRKATGESA